MRWATPDGLAFRSVEKVPPRHGSAANTVAAEATPVRATIEELLALPPSQRLARLAECLPDLTAGDVVTLVQSVLDEGGPAYGNTALVLLFTRWAELDAPGMVAALESPAFAPRLDVRQIAVSIWAKLSGTQALMVAGKKWPRMAVRAAVELLGDDTSRAEELLPWLNGRQSTDEMVGLRMIFLNRMEPARALRLGAQLNNKEIVTGAAQKLAAADPARALAIAKEMPPGRLREEALLPALQELAKMSPERFREEFDALPPAVSPRVGLTELYANSLATENTDIAATWALARPPGRERTASSELVAGHLFKAQRWDDAVKLLATAWQADSRGLEAKLFDAKSYLSQITLSANSEAAAAAPGTTPPNASLDYVPLTWPDPSDRSSSVIHLALYEWSKKDPADAAAWLATVPDTELRSHLAGMLSPEQSNDPGLMVSSEVRMKYLAAAGSDPSVALKRVPQQLEHAIWLSKRAGEYAILENDWQDAATVDRWFLSAAAVEEQARQNPRAALDFFQAMQPEERSLGAWHEAGAAYIKSDETAVSEWMRSLPPGQERDAAATALVEYLTKSGPGRDGEAAFAWAASMSGEVERAYYLETAAEVWAQEDPASARAAVAETPLPEAERAALLLKLPEGGRQ